MLGSGSKKHVVLIILVTLFLAAFIVLATPARSFVPVQGVLVEETQRGVKAHDSCAALLNDPQQSRASPLLQDAVLHVDASPAAALSLMLGVRYALGPPENPVGSQRGLHYGAESGAALHPDLSGQRARAVAEYRACRNNLLLQAL